MNSKAKTVHLAFVALLGSAGCAAGHVVDADYGVEAEVEPEVLSSEQALIRGSGGLNATGECDKSIEGDCENMTALCTEDTVDDLIRCIEGWLTTHCSCTLAASAPPKPKTPIRQVSIGSLQWATFKAAP